MADYTLQAEEDGAVGLYDDEGHWLLSGSADKAQDALHGLPDGALVAVDPGLLRRADVMTVASARELLATRPVS